MVAKGFQELDQPQSDSPTAAKESFKLLMALSANFNFKIVSMDIRAAFLQAKTLDRESFCKASQGPRKRRKNMEITKTSVRLRRRQQKILSNSKRNVKKFKIKHITRRRRCILSTQEWKINRNDFKSRR